MSSTGKRKEPWRNNERHYCAFCNVWMGSDRQSILLHENGKKHREKVEEQMKEKRKNQQKEEAKSKALQNSLAQMEAAARSSLAQDLTHFAGPSLYPAPIPVAVPSFTTSFAPPPPPPPLPTQPPPSQGNSKLEMKEWQARKKQRSEEKAKPKEGDQEDDDQIVQRKRKLAANEGYYTQISADDKEVTYLEGHVFGDLLEEEMPIQLWHGSAQATPAEQRLPAYASLWKPALIVALQRKKEDDLVSLKAVDVAFLASPEDTEERIQKSVPLTRIRIILDGNQDERIPDTVEEARILAGYDGEEVFAESEKAEIDEATGLSQWTTVHIKRTTARKELQEERARLREQRRLAAVEQAREEKRKEERRMEEAAVQSAGDSALGAYDIWNRGEKDGYKGVNIHNDMDGNRGSALSVHDLVAKKISNGRPVEFQKKASGFHAKKKKQNIRRTSADDD
ncbi:WW domain-binding protein 4 [Fistulifera solaris]|uniref:WW domain-binding protein 4 n=1 Tax=Fistulifera solaris TaxID=1519565 RepID=A0A1Z5JU48_FISSO|nr:WW domain-binding protein 4 [Fistulifera solaris]|eukprot:GAX17563.1 WW domain-binding protein 4 [Fistulifera solaris]